MVISSFPLRLVGLALTTAAAIPDLGGGAQPTLLSEDADRIAASDNIVSDIVYRTTPTGEATDDAKAPNLHHYEGATWMSRGDANADVVVVFTHTTIEPSSVLSFYSLFYGWEPSFYAVAIDQPGDVIGPFQTAGAPCHSGGMAACTLSENPDVTDCSGAYLEGFLQYLHRAFTHIRQGNKKLVLAGISFGGILFEDYIRWRSNMGDDEAVAGLILISNPGSELWPDHFGYGSCACGEDLQVTDVDWVADYYRYNNICMTLQVTSMSQDASYIAGNQEIPNLNEQLIKEKELEQRYFDSADKNMTGWKEEIFSLSVIVNTPNETTADLFRSSNMSLPGLRWGSHADLVKARLPKLILYSRTEFNGTMYYAWELLQKPVQEACTIEKQNCTLSYVDVIGDNWRRGVMSGWNITEEAETVPPVLDPTKAPPESPSDIYLWGHWVQVVAPHMTREKVEAWMATAIY